MYAIYYLQKAQFYRASWTRVNGNCMLASNILFLHSSRNVRHENEGLMSGRESGGWGLIGFAVYESMATLTGSDRKEKRTKKTALVPGFLEASIMSHSMTL